MDVHRKHFKATFVKVVICVVFRKKENSFIDSFFSEQVERKAANRGTFAWAGFVSWRIRPSPRLECFMSLWICLKLKLLITRKYNICLLVWALFSPQTYLNHWLCHHDSRSNDLVWLKLNKNNWGKLEHWNRLWI